MRHTAGEVSHGAVLLDRSELAVDAKAFVAALAGTFARDRLALNLFLFAGPDDRPQAAMDGLTQVARRHGGRFELLTTRRLEELTAQGARSGTAGQ